VNQRPVRVARDEEHAQLRTDHRQSLSEIGTVHERHDDICDQQIDGLAAAVVDRDRLASVRGLENRVAARCENVTRETADYLLVLGEEDCLAASAGARLTAVPLLGLLGGAREVDPERRSPAALALELDVSAGPRDDAVDGRETESLPPRAPSS